MYVRNVHRTEEKRSVAAASHLSIDPGQTKETSNEQNVVYIARLHYTRHEEQGDDCETCCCPKHYVDGNGISKRTNRNGEQKISIAKDSINHYNSKRFSLYA